MRYILILGAIGLAAYFIINGAKKKSDAPAQSNVNDQMMREAYTQALTVYQKPIVQNAERIFQLETKGYTKPWTFSIFSPGMDAMSSVYPYGWESLNKFWEKNPLYAPTSSNDQYNDYRDNGMPLVAFPTFIAAVMTLCYFLSTHDNNAGRWHSLAAYDQQLYNERIAQIIPVYSL